DASEADAGRLITGRNLERHGIGVHRSLRRRQFDFVEMRLAIRGCIDAQALHCGWLLLVWHAETKHAYHKGSGVTPRVSCESPGVGHERARRGAGPTPPSYLV